jgi:hypothetical protein
MNWLLDLDPCNAAQNQICLSNSEHYNTQVIESTKIYLFLAASAADPWLVHVQLVKVGLAWYLAACSYRQGSLRHVVIRLLEQLEGNLRMNAAAVLRYLLSIVAQDLPQVLAKS